MSRRALATTLLLSLALLASAAHAQQTPGDPATIFRVVPDPELGFRGGPVLSGVIYNETGNRAGDVRLRIEVLDASGQVIGETTGWAYGVVPANGRGYFSIPIKQKGASYRVTVVSFTWFALQAP